MFWCVLTDSIRNPSTAQSSFFNSWCGRTAPTVGSQPMQLPRCRYRVVSPQLSEFLARAKTSGGWWPWIGWMPRACYLRSLEHTGACFSMFQPLLHMQGLWLRIGMLVVDAVDRGRHPLFEKKCESHNSTKISSIPFCWLLLFSIVILLTLSVLSHVHHDKVKLWAPLLTWFRILQSTNQQINYSV